MLATCLYIHSPNNCFLISPPIIVDLTYSQEATPRVPCALSYNCFHEASQTPFHSWGSTPSGMLACSGVFPLVKGGRRREGRTDRTALCLLHTEGLKDLKHSSPCLCFSVLGCLFLFSNRSCGNHQPISSFCPLLTPTISLFPLSYEIITCMYLYPMNVSSMERAN